MNLGHLAVFHAVATQGNVSRAAERLMVSQPAISKQVRQLERALGAALFERLPRGMRLTRAGELLAGYAARLFALEAEAERAIAELQGLRRGRLVVGASNTIGMYLLPDVFVRFRRRFPGVELQLEIAHTDAIARWLDRGAIDLALTESLPAEASTGGGGADERLISDVFAHDRLIAIASPRHPLARRSPSGHGRPKPIRAAALCREPFIVRETGSGTESLAERALAERGLRIDPAMSLASTEAIKRAVMGGAGVAIVSELSAANEIHAGRLAHVPVRDLDLRRPLYRLRRRDGHESSASREFFKMVVEAGQ
jgi:DNA-binding transcriptional LysR family regulator